ncbi:MAG: hypothetical protein IJR87_09370 [Bacteroidaceae bacterium]|nr:hypothetical protein [Bacteroidaceae bacterium]
MNRLIQIGKGYTLNKYDCGMTALMIVAKHFGQRHMLDTFLHNMGYCNQNISLYDLRTYAKKINLNTLAIIGTINGLMQDIPLPAIAYLKVGHFVVICEVNHTGVFVIDPSIGYIQFSKSKFKSLWYLHEFQGGALIVFEKETQDNV